MCANEHEDVSTVNNNQVNKKNGRVPLHANKQRDIRGLPESGQIVLREKEEARKYLTW
jgi:hypothetical protein